MPTVCKCASKMEASIRIFAILLVCLLCQKGCRAEQPEMTVVSTEQGKDTTKFLQRQPYPLCQTEMIQYWGYPAEEHLVTTEDGYIVMMHRIPYGRNEKPEDAKQQLRTPVYMGHCLLCSSSVFSFGPPEYSMAYILADAGYDVWMENQRGNTWSKNHVSLDSCSNCSEFWHYSWDDSAVYDYTATIDYVLDQTSFSDLFFVGFSMGTTRYFALLSLFPEYNAKIKAGFMMGPAASQSNPGSLDNTTISAEDIQDYLHEHGHYEFLPSYDAFHYIAHEVCDDEHPVTQIVCENIFNNYLGVTPDQLNTSMISFYLDHLPAGTSTETIVHYEQLYLKGNDTFQRYDWGEEENMIKYGQPEPPIMDLTTVTAPTALYAGDGDNLANMHDVDVIASKLPNLIEYHIVEYSGWTHLDFIMGMDAATLVYQRILDHMNSML